MKTFLRGAVVLLLPLLCFPLSEISTSAPAATPSHTASASHTPLPPSKTPTVLAPTPTPTEISIRRFADGFDSDGILEETDRMEMSASPDWWVNSGGWLVQRDGVGGTWAGEAPIASPWRIAYFQTNPWDTDQGAHPQNLFRLITRSAWTAPTQQAYFRIVTDRLSPSANRNQSNGLLLFGRYADGENLFYAGLRVDGYAVIKKKSGGAYTTLAEAPFFPGIYQRTTSPNLIPHGVWIGLRTAIRTEGDAVTIQLYIDPDRSDFWTLALQAETSVDPSHPLARPGFAGIRTDFMDVEFDDYLIEEPISES
jgi:hypothetical protein